jgi:hypothetical protein
MSKYLTEKYLKYVAALRGKPIDQDMQCEYCGYNLRGLSYGKACPECGTPIQYRREPDLAFYDMPLPLIKGFRLSCWMAILAFLGMVAFWVIDGLRGGSAAGAVLALMVVGLWLTAVWRLTQPLNVPQAVAHGFSPRSRLRSAARWLQLGWLLALGARLAALAPAVLAPPSILYGRLTVFGVLVGIVGIGALALFLARFANWVRDEFAVRAFTTAVWGWVFLTPLLLLLPVIQVTVGPLVVFLLPALIVVIIVLVLVTVAALPVGLYSLSRSVDWSVIHAMDRTDRDRRLHERLAPRPSPRVESAGPIHLADPPPETPREPPRAGQ